MNTEFTAMVTKSDGWWIGWVAEIPRVNCQERSREELLISLKQVLQEAIEFNRLEAESAAGSNFSEERIAV